MEFRASTLHVKQAAFAASESFITGFVAGRGGGKTKIGALDILLRSRDGDPFMGVAPDYSVIDDTVFGVFRETCKEYGCFIKERLSPTPKIWFRSADGGIANIIFKSGEVPQKLEGPSKIGLWLDEASIMVKEVMMSGLPILRHRGQMGRCTMTFTPRGRKHWTFETFFAPVPPEEYDDVAAYWEWWEAHPEQPRTRYRDVEKICGKFYRHKSDTKLIYAHTLDNPFTHETFYEKLAPFYSSTLRAQMLAGQFIDADGLIFKRESFELVDDVPRSAVRVRYWDRASTPGGGDFTAGVLMARANGIFYIEDVKRGQWSPMERNKIIEDTARLDALRYDNSVLIYAEQEGGSAGPEISEQFIQRLAGFPVYRDIVGGKRTRMVGGQELPGEAKVVRAMPLAAQAEAGNVCVLRDAWTEDLLDELACFPESEHDDQVDACSGAFNKLQRHNVYDPGEVGRTSVEPSIQQFGLTLTKSRQRRRGV